jgi:hypothetical protein
MNREPPYSAGAGRSATTQNFFLGATGSEPLHAGARS